MPDYAALVAAPDRSDADRKADARRDPVPFLAFAGLRPGMKVLDMGAGGGYSTELIARAVASGGIVYGRNAPDLGEKAKAAFDARLKTPAMKDAVADVRGQVTLRGNVKVTVRAGSQWAYGCGRLSKNLGGGVWRGQGNSDTCGGMWVAERRG